MILLKRNEIFRIAYDIDERVRDLDNIIFSLGEERDKEVYMSNEWIKKNAEINLIQIYKDEIIKQGERLRKLL